jgi:hypothetical protein
LCQRVNTQEPAYARIINTEAIVVGGEAEFAVVVLLLAVEAVAVAAGQRAVGRGAASGLQHAEGIVAVVGQQVRLVGADQCVVGSLRVADKCAHVAQVVDQLVLLLPHHPLEVFARRARGRSRQLAQPQPGAPVDDQRIVILTPLLSNNTSVKGK